mmetsp:Transcript_32310/g.58640  ORF Transcript_32310/g.58640 Transcript_32310/m.58640 type:complete len:196 (-) Transcript_32310:111-698(-)
MGQTCCREIQGYAGIHQEAVPEDELVNADELEHLMKELFRLHDLNGNGLLEVEELVQLNSKVALLHYGKDCDLMAVKQRYRDLFKERLDAQGRPATYDKFKAYVLQVLNSMDPDPLAQEMILEQFAAEARSARAVFHLPSFSSHADKGFLPHLSFHTTSFPSRSPGTKTGLVRESFSLQQQASPPISKKAKVGGA